MLLQMSCPFGDGRPGKFRPPPGDGYRFVVGLPIFAASRRTASLMN